MKYTSACGIGACVEIATTEKEIFLRDGKNPKQKPLRFTKREWKTFLDKIRKDKFKT